MIIETERLLLRDLKSTDLNDYYELNSDYKVSYLQGFKNFCSILEAQKKLAEIMTLNEEYAIFLKSQQKVIGTFSMHPHSLARSNSKNNYTIGYGINEKYQKQGYMTELLPIVIDYLFVSLNANCIWACHLLGNKASKKLIIRNDFVFIKYSFYHYPNSNLVRLKKIYCLKKRDK